MDTTIAKELLTSLKVRIQVDNQDLADELKDWYGGWIFTCDDGAIFWYSFHYKQTEIMMDRKGGGILK